MASPAYSSHPGESHEQTSHDAARLRHLRQRGRTCRRSRPRDALSIPAPASAPPSRTASSRATSMPPAAWSGRAPTVPSRVMFEVSSTEDFANATRLAALDTSPASDFTVKRLLTDLASDQDIFYRMTAADLADINTLSEPIVGRFRTAPASRRNIRFAWSGDTAGQGWGIDDDGMKTYATMAKHTPDFFLHSGDTIYADGPMVDEVDLPDGCEVEEQRADRREAQGRRDARRVSRPVEIQSDGPATCWRSTPSARPSSSGTTTRWSTTGRARRTCRPTTATRKSRSTCWRPARRAPSTK